MRVKPIFLFTICTRRSLTCPASGFARLRDQTACCKGHGGHLVPQIPERAGRIITLLGGFEYIYIYTYVLCIYGLVFVFLPPPNGMGPGSTPFPSICKLLAAFLRSSLLFAI